MKYFARRRNTLAREVVTTEVGAISVVGRLACAAAVLVAGLGASSYALAQESPFHQAQSRQDPPPEVFHCIRPAPDTTLDFVMDGELAVSLDADRRQIVVSLPQPSATVTCYSLWREPAASGPVTMEWNAAGQRLPASVTEPLPEYAGTYCYYLVVGDTRGHSATDGERTCVEVPASLAPTPPPTPTPGATPEPYELGPFSGPFAPDAGTGTTGKSDPVPAWLPFVLLSLGLGAAIVGAKLRRRSSDRTRV